MFLTQNELELFSKKIPDEPGWYYLAIYHPEAKKYYEYHCLLDNQIGYITYHIGGIDELTLKELKAKEKKNRMYLIGKKIMTAKEHFIALSLLPTNIEGFNKLKV